MSLDRRSFATKTALGSPAKLAHPRCDKYALSVVLDWGGKDAPTRFNNQLADEEFWMNNKMHNAVRHLPAVAVILLSLIITAGCLTYAKDSGNGAPMDANSRAATATKQTADKLPAADLTHASLPVSGMTCTDCEEAIQHSVAKLNGVSMVMASYTKGRVEVDYNPQQVNEQQIIAAIERLQYKVQDPQTAEDQAADAEGSMGADGDKADSDGQGCCGSMGGCQCGDGDMSGDKGKQA